MIFTTLKKYYLAFLAFIFFHQSYHASSIHINSSNDVESEIVSDCNETAFAFLNNDDDPLTVDSESFCFIPQFNRWGWTTFLDFSEETGQSSYILDFFAGAGQCDLTNGVDAGSVTITYNEDNTVTFDYTLEGHTLSEAHIYIGSAMYPTGNNGAETVAPGQYTFTDSDFGNVQNYSVTIPVEGLELYAIVHGVTKEEGCSDDDDDDDDDDDSNDGDDDDNNDGNGDDNDSDCDDSDTDGVCDIDDICPGHDDTIDSDGDGIPDGCDNGAYSPNSFKAYPIPFKDVVNLQYTFDYETFVNVEVFNTKGVKLVEFKNTNYVRGTIGNTRLDLSNDSYQLLFVKLTTTKNQFTKKIISFK